MDIEKFIFSFVIIYLYSAIPFSLLIGKLYRVDIRTIGSGNVGGSNLGRACGKKAFISSLILDGSKGMFAVLISNIFDINPLILFFPAVIGHSYSIFINFKGGKGVATSFGFVLGVSFIQAILAISFFLLVLKYTKYVSVSAIMAMCFYTIYSSLFSTLDFSIFAFIILVSATFWHRQNFKRLYYGKENKITWM